MPSSCRVIDHPMVQERLTRLRRSETSRAEFRVALAELGCFLAYEASRDWPLVEQGIETPVAAMVASRLADRPLTAVAVLRAGLGLLEGALRLWPEARIGHIGLVRDPATLRPAEYICRLPERIDRDEIVLFDPMLATGNSASAALSRIKSRGGRSITLISALAAPEGLATLAREHPDVSIIAAAVDARLNEHGYIVPGLGDAGDRQFGTA